MILASELIAGGVYAAEKAMKVQAVQMVDQEEDDKIVDMSVNFVVVDNEAECEAHNSKKECMAAFKKAGADIDQAVFAHGALMVVTGKNAKTVSQIQEAEAKHMQKINGIMTTKGSKVCGLCSTWGMWTLTKSVQSETVTLKNGVAKITSGKDPKVISMIQDSAMAEMQKNAK